VPSSPRPVPLLVEGGCLHPSGVGVEGPDVLYCIFVHGAVLNFKTAQDMQKFKQDFATEYQASPTCRDCTPDPYM